MRSGQGGAAPSTFYWRRYAKYRRRRCASAEPKRKSEADCHEPSSYSPETLEQKASLIESRGIPNSARMSFTMWAGVEASSHRSTYPLDLSKRVVAAVKTGQSCRAVSEPASQVSNIKTAFLARMRSEPGLQFVLADGIAREAFGRCGSANRVEVIALVERPTVPNRRDGHAPRDHSDHAVQSRRVAKRNEAKPARRGAHTGAKRSATTRARWCSGG